VSWARSKLAEVYVGQSLMGCRGLDDLGGRWMGIAGVEDGLVRLGEWTTASAAPMRIRVWLGASLSRPFVVPANSGARNVGEARELAAAIAAESTGLEGAVKVWLAPWHAGRSTLAVAVPQSLLSSLDGMSRSRRGQRVISVRPWWNQVLDPVIDRSRAQSRSIGWTLVEPDGVIHGRLASGDVADGGFEMRRAQDPDAAMLRRRLAIGWGDLEESEHFVFEASTVPRSPLFAIGGASVLQDVEAAA
jgi:hypothetical protein